MAKAAAKTPAKAPKKIAAASKTKSPSGNKIEKACEDALAKLITLGTHQQLQNDITWCLGSFKSDGNPVGLYALAERVLVVFKEEKQKNAKGITAKTLTDLEKVIKERGN